jgi:dihydroflavonol-4-reductase
MKRVLVTGATGFLGTFVVRALVERGDAKVRALARRSSEELEALGVEQVCGDVTGEREALGDATPLDQAMDGCDAVLHLAGFVSRDERDGREMMRVHVEGTRRVLRVAKAAGVSRVVVASSSGSHAVSREPEPVLDETAPDAVDVVGRFPYYLSKIYQERVAREVAAEMALDVVVVNPSLLLGPGDLRQSSTSDVVRFLYREIPVVPPGGLNFVDVRDAAAGTLAALERGRSGERYLLGGPNMTFAEFFGRLERVSKVNAPRLRIPPKLARWGASVVEHFYRARSSDPPVSRREVEMGELYWYCDSSKAKRELGFEPREALDTLDATVRDLRQRFPSKHAGGRTA